MSYPSYLPRFAHSNCTWRRAQAMKLVVMKFSPTSFHFNPFRYKYFSQLPVLKPLSPRSLLQCQIASSTPIHNHRQNNVLPEFGLLLIFLLNEISISWTLPHS
jgi:hypothetical protein